MNQPEFADQLRQGQDFHWNQAKVSRVEIGDRDLTFQEMMRVVDVLGIDALRGTYELDQIPGIVEDRVQSLKTTVLDAIESLESVHETLTDGLS